MCVHELIDCANCITAIAAIVGVIFAGIGLSVWKKQLRGTAEYDLAKRLMLQIYQLRDYLQSTRNPFLSVTEGDKNDTKDTWEITAYSKRWEQVRNIVSQFNVTSLEAEVVWDDKTKNEKQDLLELVAELNFAISMFIRQKNDKTFQKDFYDKYEDILYYKNDDDKYSKSLNKVVKDFEKILKPYLKK